MCTNNWIACSKQGVADVAGISTAAFTRYGDALSDVVGNVVAVSPTLVPASQLATLLRHNAQSGFIVDDLTDLESFAPLPDLDIPDQPLYLLHDTDRGDDLRIWSPNEALPSSPPVGEHRSPSPKASAGCCKNRKTGKQLLLYDDLIATGHLRVCPSVCFFERQRIRAV